MICKSCGAELPEETVFCPQCGAQLTEQPTDAPKETKENVTPENSAEVPTEDVAAPSKKKRGKTLLIIAAIVAVLALVVGFAWKPISNACLKLIYSDEDYFAYVNKQAWTVPATWLDLLDEKPNFENTAVAGDVTLTLGDEARLLLAQLVLGMDDTSYTDWLKEVKADYRLNYTTDAMQLLANAYLNGRKIVDADVALDVKGNALYANLPMLTKTYWTTALPSDFSEEFSNGQDTLKKVLDALPDGKTMDAIAKRYTAIVFDNMKQVGKHDVEMTIEGVSQKTTAYTATLNQDTYYAIVKELLTEFCQDDELKQILTDVAKAVGDGAESDIDRLYDEAKRELDQLDINDFEKDRSYTYTVYVDSVGNIVGYELGDRGTSLQFAFVRDGKQIAFEVYLKHNTEKLLDFVGTGTLDGKALECHAKLMLAECHALDIEITVENVLALEEGEYKGTITLSAGEDFQDLVEQFDGVDAEEITREIRKYQLRLSLDLQKDSVKETLEILKDGQNFLTIGSTATKEKADAINIPTDRTEDEEAWIDSLQLKNVQDSLKQAEMPDELAEYLLASLAG